MENIVQDAPNLSTPETVPVQKIDSGLDAIAAKMAAMRNQSAPTNTVETGVQTSAEDDTPVAPQGVESDLDAEPEVDAVEAEHTDANEDSIAPEEVSTDNSQPSDIIDFIEFAEQNPNAKFKFKRNGKEIEIDAKKAASILGQGAAISEDARQLKVDRAEFDEYSTQKRQETEGLLLAMEFTVRPQLQKAYDEILKTQGYQQTFQQQLASATDPANIARIQAAMQQNERYIQQQSAVVQQLKPNVEQFYNIRRGQVNDILENNRKNFKDKELKNSYVYNEIRDKVSKDWSGAKAQLVPGVDNIDLISSDEHILSLLRDGLKYRDRPKAKSSGASIAALTNTKARTAMPSGEKNQIEDLRKQARGGDKKAADNLLMAQLRSIRAGRNR
jgi:ribosomal protein S16